MAHFAKVVNGIVETVIVIDNTVAPDPAPINSESLGQEFIANTLGLSGEWIQTSRNKNFRANFAGPGMIWDSENQVFYRQQPFDLWTLNTETWNWEAPYPYPDDLEPTKWDSWSCNWVVNPMPVEIRNKIAQLQFSSILEAGCLLGSVTNKLVETYPNATIKGIDVVERGIELAKQYYDETLFEVKSVLEEDLTQYDIVIFDSPIPTEDNLTPAEDVVNHAINIGFTGKMFLGVYQDSTFIDNMDNADYVIYNWYEIDF